MSILCWWTCFSETAAWQSSLRDFGVLWSSEGNVNLPESPTAGSLKWDVYSTARCYLPNLFSKIQKCLDKKRHFFFFPFPLLSQKYGLALLWQLTDGCGRASQMVLSAAHPPPSAPHRWFSPAPVFQTRGPSLNLIRTSSQDGVGTSQAISKVERPHLRHETGCWVISKPKG